MRLIKSTDRIEMAPTNCHPLDGLAFHYLWELVEFGIFKNGYAKVQYSCGAHGGYERVRWCLHDVEKAFDIPRGTLTAKVHRMRLGNNDEILSAEQFVHARNLSDKIYTQDKRWRKVGGKTEFYDISKKQATARFANSYRKTNLKLGHDVMWQKRHKGQYGVPSTCGTYS
tara:strand:+ start:237 stop:746 length:510 start_codon:yes stop_codon:yes gene_type:complete